MGHYLTLAEYVPVAVEASCPARSEALPLAERCGASDSADARRVLPDLNNVLPPPSWLTSDQRRLWRERTAAYLADGMIQTEAQQVAMAELIFRGRLYNPDDSFPWPK